MGDERCLLVFTDLDGTLLDHHDYSYEAAKPALKRLSEAGIPWMIATSKTRAEVAALRQDLENHHPYVVENGGAVYVPDGYFDYPGSPPGETVLGVAYAQVRAALSELRAQQPWAGALTGFGDLSAAQVAELTGLSVHEAALAKQRASSEPLHVPEAVASPAQLAALKTFLEQRGLTSKLGGRFLHVQGPVDKAAGVRFLVSCFARQYPGASFATAALGDSQNDLAMLQVADFPIVIPKAGPDSSRLDVGREDAILPEQPGARGFREGIETLLSRVPSARYPLF